MNCSCFISTLESEQYLHIFQVLSQIWNYMKVGLNGLFKGCKKYDWPACAQKTRAVCFTSEHEYNERMDTQLLCVFKKKSTTLLDACAQLKLPQRDKPHVHPKINPPIHEHWWPTINAAFNLTFLRVAFMI